MKEWRGLDSETARALILLHNRGGQLGLDFTEPPNKDASQPSLRRYTTARIEKWDEVAAHNAAIEAKKAAKKARKK